MKRLDLDVGLNLRVGGQLLTSQRHELLAQPFRFDDLYQLLASQGSGTVTPTSAAPTSSRKLKRPIDKGLADVRLPCTMMGQS